jgi:hypothetical protein
MLQTITIRFGPFRPPIQVTLDLDELPSIDLGDEPPEWPNFSDVRIYYSAAYRLYFADYLPFIRVDHERIRRPSGHFQPAPPGREGVPRFYRGCRMKRGKK